MKTAEFKNFMANVKEYGLEASEIQCAGYLWLNLTDKQIAAVIDYAIKCGYTPDAQHVVHIGAYALTMGDEAFIQWVELNPDQDPTINPDEVDALFNDMPAVKSAKGLTYQQFIDYCKTKYTAGGDTYVECWDEKMFNDWVAQFGAMTKKRLQQMIKTNFAYEKECDAMRDWDNDEVNEQKGKVTSKMSKKKEAPADVQPAQTPEQPIEAPAPVEVLKGEVIETKNEAEINAAIGRISTVIDTIGRGYLEIVGDVARLRKFEAWKLTGHKNLYELCADKFGMSKGTVHNLEVVFKKYGDPETFQLTDACAGMSLREMLQNIDAEKKAIAGEVAGEAADGDGNGEATDSKKTKTQTIINVSYELAGDDWDADAILDEIRKQLEQNPDAKEAFPDGATVNFTISI